MEPYEDALADYDRAIEVNPDDALALAGRGLTYRMMVRYEDALADCSRAIELSPGDAATFASRGETYRLMGRGRLQPSDRAHARFCPGPPPEVSALPNDGA